MNLRTGNDPSSLVGHVELSTTQIHTQVSIRKLKEIHERTHPGARLGRVPDDRLEDDPEQDHPEVGDLVADLEAEAEEEDRENGSGMIFGFDDLDPEE